MLYKVMGPKKNIWHLQQHGADKPLCGMNPEKIDHSWEAQRIVRWNGDTNFCSHCYWSKIATEERIRFLYPKSLGEADGNSFEFGSQGAVDFAEHTRIGDVHRWQEFSVNCIDVSTTHVKMREPILSARVSEFCVIDKNGFVIPVSPFEPGALPVLEVDRLKSNHKTTQAKIIVDLSGDNIVYYPVAHTFNDEWSHSSEHPTQLARRRQYLVDHNILAQDDVDKMRLYAYHSFILTEIDKIVISGAISAAFKCKEYFDV